VQPYISSEVVTYLFLDIIYSWVFHYSRPLHSLCSISWRLILRQAGLTAGGINSLGTTIGPIVVSIALFGVIAGLILKNLLKKKTLWIL
jgi:hypothetical protein